MKERFRIKKKNLFCYESRSSSAISFARISKWSSDSQLQSSNQVHVLTDDVSRITWWVINEIHSLSMWWIDTQEQCDILSLHRFRDWTFPASSTIEDIEYFFLQSKKGGNQHVRLMSSDTCPFSFVPSSSFRGFLRCVVSWFPSLCCIECRIPKIWIQRVYISNSLCLFVSCTHLLLQEIRRTAHCQFLSCVSASRTNPNSFYFRVPRTLTSVRSDIVECYHHHHFQIHMFHHFHRNVLFISGQRSSFISGR